MQQVGGSPKAANLIVLALLVVVLAMTGHQPARADVPVGPPKLIPCPGSTGDSRNYPGDKAPYRCHSAIIDPLGNNVLLREGRSYSSGPGAFGWLHALRDHNVADLTIEKVVSSAVGISAPHGRKRYIAEYRSGDYGIMSVWVEVDPSRSTASPDSEPFGVITAYCKLPGSGSPESFCPDWVNDTI